MAISPEVAQKNVASVRSLYFKLYAQTLVVHRPDWRAFGRLQQRPNNVPENTNPRYMHSKAFRVVAQQNTLQLTPRNDQLTTLI